LRQQVAESPAVDAVARAAAAAMAQLAYDDDDGPLERELVALDIAHPDAPLRRAHLQIRQAKRCTARGCTTLTAPSVRVWGSR
jgi:hypothetical protein